MPYGAEAKIGSMFTERVLPGRVREHRRRCIEQDAPASRSHRPHRRRRADAHRQRRTPCPCAPRFPTIGPISGTWWRGASCAGFSCRNGCDGRRLARSLPARDPGGRPAWRRAGRPGGLWRGDGEDRRTDEAMPDGSLAHSPVSVAPAPMGRDGICTSRKATGRAAGETRRATAFQVRVESGVAKCELAELPAAHRGTLEIVRDGTLKLGFEHLHRVGLQPWVNQTRRPMRPE